MRNKIGKAGLRVAAICWIVSCGGGIAMAAPKPPAVEIAEPGAAAGTNAAEDALVRQVAALLETVSAMDDQGKPLVEPNKRPSNP